MSHITKFIFTVFVCSFVLHSCINKDVTNETNNEHNVINSIPVFKYLEGFEIDSLESGYVINVLNPSSGQIFQTLKLQELNLPFDKIVTISSTHISFFEAVGKLDKIVGMPHPEYSLSKNFTQLYKAGRVKDLSQASDLDFEKTIALTPDVIFIYPFGAKDMTKYEQAGISIIHIAEYLESHPLAKAEWVKVFGFFTGNLELANTVFEQIESSYFDVQKEAENQTNPTAFLNLPFKGKWNQAAGNSYFSYLLKDAGFDYIWKNHKRDGNLEFDFEQVYEAVIDVDYWFIASSKPENFTLADLVNEDRRFAEFKSVKDTNVYFCNTAFVDYFGQGTIEPHIILKDLLNALQGIDEAKYFKKLK